MKIEIEGKSRDLFRDDVFQLIERTLREYGVEDALVFSAGRSPLDFTIKARVRAAAIKAGVFE